MIFPATPNLWLEAVLEKLRTRQLGRTLQIVDKCSSTNDIAAQWADAGAAHGYTVIAEEQTAGRGRQGRSWLSPRGGIWMTTILRPPFTFNPPNGLPLLGALAIAKAISSSLGVKSMVRWPNDVVVNHHKLAGVLAETKFSGNQMEYALLGMGINANFHPDMIKEIGATSESLLHLIGSPINREALICSLLLETEDLYELASSHRDDDVKALLRNLDCSRGKNVKIKVEGEEIEGVLEDYDTITQVRIKIPHGTYKLLETGSVISVEYNDERRMMKINDM